MHKTEEEYEPKCDTDANDGSGYTPSIIDKSATPMEVEEEYNPDETETSYKPSIEYIQSNYVACFGKTSVDSGYDNKISDLSSDTDTDSDFDPIPEPLKRKHHLTTEEINNYQTPNVAYDLEPEKYPQVPQVRDIAIPPQVKMFTLGVVEKIMSMPVPLVIVHSIEGMMTPLNDESMVFDVDRKPVGLIFETFGPVKRPYYSVRFNSMVDIEAAGLKVDSQILYSEGFSEFVNTEKLIKEKGCDASWEHDKEAGPHHQEFSDDEDEKNTRQRMREARLLHREKYAPAKADEIVQQRRLKEEQMQESTVYICGLPPDFRERDIKELFGMFGVKKVNLLRYPDGTSKSSGFVTCCSRSMAQDAVDKLNMKLTLEGSSMPLAVKFSDPPSKRKRAHTDLDTPDKNDSYTNNSYIVTFEKKAMAQNDRYKVKERSHSASHTLHTLLPDEEDTPGVKHAFTKPVYIPTAEQFSTQGASGSSVAPDYDEVFNWGSEPGFGTISTNSRYSSSRIMPPELANPNQHPSPFEDTSKKMKTFITPISINVVDVPKPNETPTPPLSARIPLVEYESDSDASDPENPSCMAFCSENDKGVPQPKRASSSEQVNPSDARRDSKVLNSLFAKAVLSASISSSPKKTT